MRDRLVALMRPISGDSLAAYGIIATKGGGLELRADRLAKQLATDPHGLDALIGKASASAPTGIAGALDTYLKGWNNVTNGQITKRKEATTNLQEGLTDRQATLDKQYDAAYQRYLRQFTQLQTLQSRMSSNVSMFDALFGDKK